MNTCARGHRCPGRAKADTAEGDRPAWVGAETSRPLCDSCAQRLAEHIRDLPGLYVQLANLLPPGQGGGDGRSSRGEIGAPIDLGVEAQMRRMVLVATTWDAAVRDVSGDGDEPSGVRDYTALATVCSYLATRVSVLMALPAVTVNRWDPAATLPSTGGDVVGQVDMDGADGCLELFEVWEAAYFTAGVGKRTELLEQPCWDCGVEAVVRVVGEDRVTCKACRASMTLDDYDLMIYRSAHFRSHGHMRAEAVEAYRGTCDCDWRGPLRPLEQLAADDLAEHRRIVADVRRPA